MTALPFKCSWITFTSFCCIEVINALHTFAFHSRQSAWDFGVCDSSDTSRKRKFPIMNLNCVLEWKRNKKMRNSVPRELIKFFFLEIFSVLNVAAGKAPMQISTDGAGIPQKAIDGSTSSFFSPDTCSLTKSERVPWWYVNLLEPYMVQLVRLDFGKSCCGE